MAFRRRRGFKRRWKPTQWVRGSDWGTVIDTGGAPVITSILVSLRTSVATNTPPSIGRLKLERVQGRIMTFMQGAIGDSSMYGFGLYIGRILTAGGIEVWDPLLATDMERNWIWHDAVIMHNNTGSSGNVMSFTLPNGFYINRRVGRGLRDGEAFIFSAKRVNFVAAGAPTTEKLSITFRTLISKIS